MVVLIHSYNSVWQGVEWGSCYVVPHFVSRVLPTFAVPLFFAISGYLFFLKRRDFGVCDYVEKLKKRLLTLLVPYVVWNILAFALYSLKSIAGGQVLENTLSPDIFWGCKTFGTATVNWLGWSLAASTAPVLMQLWFVRDLIVCVVFTPFIYTVLRRGGFVGLLLFAVVYYGHLWPNFGGMSFTGPWFFALGAWFSISGNDPIRSTRRLLAPSLALLLPAWLALELFPDGENIVHALFQPTYVLAAMVTSIHLADLLSRRSAVGRFMPDSSFFVYASHTMVLLPLTGAAATLSSGCGMLIQVLSFLACPMVSIATCLLVFYMLRRWLPHLSAPLTGIYGSRKN